jgi:anthranilate phosphoribosyltransferase
MAAIVLAAREADVADHADQAAPRNEGIEALLPDAV